MNAMDKHNQADIDKGKEGQGTSTSLALVVAGGNKVIGSMAACATQNTPMLALHGSGRIADLWNELWPTRFEGAFDPVAMRKDKPRGDNDVCNLREVLAKGDLSIHPITSNSAWLQRLCRLHFTATSCSSSSSNGAHGTRGRRAATLAAEGAQVLFAADRLLRHSPRDSRGLLADEESRR